MHQETLERGKRLLARRLRRRANEICKAQPGYGSPAYRGDPWQAIALRQQADRLDAGSAAA